jgi:hypothetical protein
MPLFDDDENGDRCVDEEKHTLVEEMASWAFSDGETYGTCHWDEWRAGSEEGSRRQVELRARFK